MTDKIIAILGFASKAGALCYGATGAIEAVKKGRAKGIFYVCDISPKTRKELMFYCQKHSVPIYELKCIGMEELTRAVGRKCGAAAVLNDNFKNPLVMYLTSDI